MFLGFFGIGLCDEVLVCELFELINEVVFYVFSFMFEFVL